MLRSLVKWINLIVGNEHSSTSLDEVHFKIVGSFEADSKQIYWDSSERISVEPKVNFQAL